MKRWLIVIVLGGLSLPNVLGQTDLALAESRLGKLLDSVRKASTDAEKIARNEAFRATLEKTIKEPTTFTYPFDKIRTLGTIESPDNQIRLYTWNLEMDDKSQRYFCFIQKVDARKRSVKVYELKEDLENFNYRTEEVIDGQKWYGALYYQIIPVLKNNKTVYTVLGWDGHTERSTIKLIDIMTINGNSVKFGAPIFKVNDKIKKRIYFEHAEQSVMSCRWENTQQRIVFDHLSPETPTLEGFYEYYVPDMSYDAFEYQGNKWVLIEDIIGVNATTVQVKLHKIDEETGEIEAEVVKNEWLDPSKGGSPQNTHVAAKPDKEVKIDNSKPKKDGPVSALDLYNSKKKNSRNPDSKTKIGRKKRRG